MSDWDPNWGMFLESLLNDSASASASSSASAPPVAANAAPHGVRIPTSDEYESLGRLKDYIHGYLIELELIDFARLFLEEAERNAGVPPVEFVETWVQLESQMIPCSAPQCDELAAMLDLDKGVKEYLDHLKLDTRSFKEKTWEHDVYRIPLIEIWMDRIYPRIIAGIPVNDGII